jgi:predicted Ser/Thr protein kinase
LKSVEELAIKRLSGLSNACYKVTYNHESVLYRKKSSTVADKEQEALLFEAASTQGLGPKCIYQTSEFRIEEYVEGRCPSIWEMQSPIIQRQILDKLV